MRKLTLCLALWLAAGIGFSGNTVRLNSRHFTVLLTEPDGWVLDTKSAAQIAHFVLHERGTPWRQAEAVVFGRFSPRGESETAETLILEDEGRFRLECPAADVRERDLELESPYPFTVKSFRCPGSRIELVAVATLPSSFTIFVLSSGRADLLESRLEAFKEILEGFRWLPREEPPRIRLPQPPE